MILGGGLPCSIIRIQQVAKKEQTLLSASNHFFPHIVLFLRLFCAFSNDDAEFDEHLCLWAFSHTYRVRLSIQRRGASEEASRGK